MAVVATVTEAKRKLPELAKLAGDLGHTITLTRRGEPYVVMMSASEYEGILETLEILSDPEAMGALKSSEEDIQAGRLKSWREFKHEL